MRSLVCSILLLAATACNSAQMTKVDLNTQADWNNISYNSDTNIITWQVVSIKMTDKGSQPFGERLNTVDIKHAADGSITIATASGKSTGWIVTALNYVIGGAAAIIAKTGLGL